MMATVNWPEILSQSYDALDEKTTDEIRKQIFRVEVDGLSSEDLKQFFELSRNILKDTLVMFCFDRYYGKLG